VGGGVGGPAEASELVSREGPAIGLLPTDLVMPAMSGPDPAAEVRRVHPDLCVLYMSGFNDRRVDGPLLKKPFSVEELGVQVRGVIDTASPAGTLVVSPL